MYQQGTYFWYPDYKIKEVKDSSPCMHQSCTECHGSGRKQNGGMCVHMISCPCSRCNPYFM